MELSCKRCGSTSFVKHGFVRGLQRYRCKTCGLNFTDTPKRGRSEATKALAARRWGLVTLPGLPATTLSMASLPLRPQNAAIRAPRLAGWKKRSSSWATCRMPLLAGC